MSKFLLLLFALFTINQCGDYAEPGQDEETSTATGKSTGKRQHKPW